jgi:apoptosis-inducing factor 3
MDQGWTQTLEEQDVTFHMRSTATSITASTSTAATNKAGAVVVKNVDTDASATLEADLVVMGVGVAPATGFLKGTGIEIRKDGGVIVDELLRVKFKPQEGVSGIAKGNIFAIGDVAVYPDPEGADGQRRVEHWNVRSCLALRLLRRKRSCCPPQTLGCWKPR